MRVNDGLALGIERHGAEWRPVACSARSASRIAFPSPEVELVASSKNRRIVASMGASLNFCVRGFEEPARGASLIRRDADGHEPHITRQAL